jgi:hypothetical protein
MESLEMPAMNSLARRVDRIEERLAPEKGPWLRWPNADGTFTEVPGCRSLADVAAICRTRGRERSEVNHDDRIRHNPTE